jgi:hypothetical protein
VFHSHRWGFLQILVSVLWVGCSGSAATVPPQPSGPSSPPAVAGRGTVAVVSGQRVYEPTHVSILLPNSDQIARKIPIEGSHLHANSLVFDRRGHLYIGINDTSSGGHYLIQEINVPNWTNVRLIGVPQWSHSSVAIDDENDLYVNTKAFIGGDIKIFRNNKETKPYLEIKDPHSPLTMLAGRDALWVGYEGALSNALARYRFRSTDRTWFELIGSAIPIALAVNPDGTLVAALVRRNSKNAVDVIDVKSGKRVRTLVESSSLPAMTSDESGNVYVSEATGGGRKGKIYVCTFNGCHFSFEIISSIANALAVSPLDGKLYVAAAGKPGLQVYDQQTGRLVRNIAVGYDPNVLAIEP